MESHALLEHLHRNQLPNLQINIPKKDGDRQNEQKTRQFLQLHYVAVTPQRRTKLHHPQTHQHRLTDKYDFSGLQVPLQSNRADGRHAQKGEDYNVLAIRQ